MSEPTNSARRVFDNASEPSTIRTLRLDDVDLGNRRLTIATVTRPLDELTHRLLLDWLSNRRDRWPTTANPYLIINKQTANATRPPLRARGTRLIK